MNILVFIWRDIKNPEAGGSEIYFHELAKCWVKNGNKVTMICGGWKACKKVETIDGIRIIRVGNYLTTYLRAPFEYFKIAKNIDVIIDVENGIPFFAPLFSKKKKFLHIHHVHKDVWFKEKNIFVALVGYILENKLMPIVYKNTGVITISKSSKEEIIEEKISKNVVGIVNPGIKFYDYKKQKKNKNPTILFLNRVKKYKGLKIMLDAVKEIQKINEIKNLEVFVGGEGEYLQEMKDYTKKENLKNVFFLGKISEEKKKEIMQKSWIFINSSFKEGWGIVNIEANYFGTPVIGSNVGGIKDSVIDGKTGLLF